jgi:precorrin-6Y C5,15-methyltransferase (decarboxylating)
MMEKVRVVVFAGTSEGRLLAEYLNQNEISACVCVATEYGEELMEEMPFVQVRTGRMDVCQMETLLKELAPTVVVDATHPYADVVTENIKNACKQAQMEYLRLLRAQMDLEQQPFVVTFQDTASAASWLNQQSGNILLTTGMKELPVFAEQIQDRTRIFARVLLQESVFDDMERLGLSKKQFICMQGPFLKEMNIAMLKQVQASFLVTKESGTAGGFMEKVEAAKEAGATCVVISRPVAEQGYSLEEIKELLGTRFGVVTTSDADETLSSPDAQPKVTQPGSGMDDLQKVTLLGIGMGDLQSLTLEGERACREADCIIGADRMLETLKHFGKPMVSMYRSGEIADYIRQHKEYRKVVVGLSGDVGFYSGAKALLEQLKDMDTQLICGISSVVYFASRLQTSWEDMKLVSSHGRDQNLIGEVLANRKVFTLASYAKSIREMAKELVEYGLGDVIMHVGADLSYPTEDIRTATPEQFLDYEAPGICVAVLENEQASSYVVTHGMPDEAFLRGKAPMTKEEVRSISLSKLRLTADAVVYDVGAGTGSVSVECARTARKGHVYAIERKDDALALMEENKKKFGVSNLTIVRGLAPEAMESLPAPTHAFIGGSGGNLKEIIQLLQQKNPNVRIVINCITLETVCETMDVLKELESEDVDICCANIAKSKSLAGYHMMMGQNPVYIISFSGKTKNNQ